MSQPDQHVNLKNSEFSNNQNNSYIKITKIRSSEGIKIVKTFHTIEYVIKVLLTTYKWGSQP